jgi:hypothetical protein
MVKATVVTPVVLVWTDGAETGAQDLRNAVSAPASDEAE